MATYQIEATIEKLEQGGIQLKGTGEYLFKKTSEKKKEEEYCNIFELKPDDEIFIESQNKKPPIKLESVEYNKPIYFTDKFKDLLTQAFIEKKSFKFDLEYEDRDKKYTITAISQPHAS